MQSFLPQQSDGRAAGSRLTFGGVCFHKLLIVNRSWISLSEGPVKKNIGFELLIIPQTAVSPVEEEAVEGAELLFSSMFN